MNAEKIQCLDVRNVYIEDIKKYTSSNTSSANIPDAPISAYLILAVDTSLFINLAHCLFVFLTAVVIFVVCLALHVIEY